MNVEKRTVIYVKRTMWLAQCPTCGESYESLTSKKETRCSCGTWVPYKKTVFESEEYAQ